MGIQFYWFYDVLLAAIFIGTVFVCARAGFTKMIAGLIGGVLAFTVATGLSMPAAVLVYDSFIQPRVAEQIHYTEPREAASPGSAKAAFDTLRGADMSQALIAGRTIAEIEPEIVFDDLGKITLDLSDVDLKNTGIADGDLGFFGLDAAFALEPTFVGKVDIIASDYTKYALKDIVLARIISYRISERAVSNYDELSKIMSETMPSFTRVAGSGMDTITLLLIHVINTGGDSLETVVNDYLVKPATLVPLRALLFIIIFALVAFLAALIAKATNIINALPLLGKVNNILGGIMGAAQAAVIILLVCIAIRVIISLTGDDIILLNTMTIDRTYLFSRVYNLKLINF